MTARLDDILADAVGDDRPDTIVLMRLLGEAATEQDARHALARAMTTRTASADQDGLARLARLKRLWAAQPQAWSVVRAVLAVASHDPTDGPQAAALQQWADVFDRLAAGSPEAGVALYSLGSAELLDAATREIVTYLDGLGLLGPDRDVLDLGCGIGRVAAALAPRVRSVLGVDISGGMVGEARRRCEDFANVRFHQSDGRGVAFVAVESVDLVLAADVFPYLVQAGGGLAEAHIRGFDRVLRPGGTALILNFSYRGDRDADRRDVMAAVRDIGLSIVRNGTSDLELWDAATFLLVKRN